MRFGELLLFVSFGTSALGGVMYEMQSGQRRTLVSVEGRKIRLEQKEGSQGLRTVIVDGDSRTMLLLQPEQKQYLRVNLDAVEKARAQARRGTDGAAPATPSAGEDVSFEPTGKTEKVAGLLCRGYRGLRDGKRFLEGCFIAWDAVGLLPADFAPLITTAESVAMGQKDGRAAPAKLGWDKAPGFPAKRMNFSPTGKRIAEERLVQLQKTRIPKSAFDVPKGYTASSAMPDDDAQGL